MKKVKGKIPRKIRRIMPKKEQHVVTKLVKPVGRNSDNLGRIYLPGNWIGKKVKITLLE
jgi:putative transposon-encoded protein